MSGTRRSCSGQTFITPRRSCWANRAGSRSASLPDSRANARRRQAIKTLVWFHRWLGVATCLIFGLWFASGAVLLFKPFPSLSHADQLRLEAPIDVGAVAISPRGAAIAAGRPAALRLVQRSGAPAYIATT